MNDENANRVAALIVFLAVGVVFVAALAWLRGLARRRRDGAGAEAATPRMPPLVLGFFLVAASLLLLAPWLAPGDPARPEAPPPGLPALARPEVLGYAFGSAALFAVAAVLILPRRPDLTRTVLTAVVLGPLALGLAIDLTTNGRPAFVLGGLLACLIGPAACWVLSRLFFADRRLDAIVRQAQDSGDPRAAAEALRDEIDARGPSELRLGALGHFLLESGDHAGAIDAYKQLEALVGRKPLVLYNQGYAQRRAGRPDEAARLLDEAIRLAPEDFPLVPLFAGHHAEALADLDRLDEARARFRLAEARFHPEQHDEQGRAALESLLDGLRRRLGIPEALPPDGP